VADDDKSKQLRPVSLSGEREIFSNQFLRLYGIVADFGEFTREYFVTDKGIRVGTILLRDEEILLVRQYRFLIDDMSWEIPGGGVATGESLEDAAIRECREEAAVDCGPLKHVFSYQQGIDVTKSPAHVFSCTEFQARPLVENNETDDRQWVPVETALSMALDGRIQDSFTITALFAFHHLR